MIKAEDFKWLDRVCHLFHLGSYLCLSGLLTDCFLPLKFRNLHDFLVLEWPLSDLKSSLSSWATNIPGQTGRMPHAPVIEAIKLSSCSIELGMKF